MKNEITYKTKVIVLIIIIFILFIASYNKSFSETFAAKRELKVVNSKLESLESYHNKLYDIKNEINLLDNIIGGNTNNPEKIQQKILDFITKMDSDVDVVEIKDIHLSDTDKFFIYSNNIKLEGDYESLVSVLYNLEKQFRESRVVSSSIENVRDYKNKKNKLIMTIIFQNYENKI